MIFNILVKYLITNKKTKSDSIFVSKLNSPDGICYAYWKWLIVCVFFEFQRVRFGSASDTLLRRDTQFLFPLNPHHTFKNCCVIRMRNAMFASIAQLTSSPFNSTISIQEIWRGAVKKYWENILALWKTVLYAYEWTYHLHIFGGLNSEIQSSKRFENIGHCFFSIAGIACWSEVFWESWRQWVVAIMF